MLRQHRTHSSTSIVPITSVRHFCTSTLQMRDESECSRALVFISTLTPVQSTSLLREDQDSRKGSCTDSGPSVPNWKSQSSCPTLHRARQERGAAELHDRCRPTCPGTQGFFRESLDWGVQSQMANSRTRRLLLSTKLLQDAPGTTSSSDFTFHGTSKCSLK